MNGKPHIFLILLLMFQFQQKCDVFAEENSPTPHAQGEWYQIGYQMAQESLPIFRLLEVPESDANKRLIGVLNSMGVSTNSLKSADINFMQQGWDDCIAGKKESLTCLMDQKRSLAPVPLRGFHKFDANMATNQSLADNAAEWKRAVSKVRVTTADGEAHGTGFFIGPGLLVTNYHVIDSYTKIEVQLESDNSVHVARVIASQEVPDVALLKIEWKDNDVLPIGNSDLCKELEEVVMIGYPEFANLSATYVKGNVSSTKVIYRKQFEVLQLDIRANPGNSGAPIISSNGCIVGVLTFGLGKIDATLAQFTFAQKINAILPFLEKYADGEFERIKE